MFNLKKVKKSKIKLFRTFSLVFIVTTVFLLILVPTKQARACGDEGQEEQTHTFTAVSVTYETGFTLSGTYGDTYSDDGVYHKSRGRMFRFYEPGYGRIIIFVLNVVYTFNIKSAIEIPLDFLTVLEIEVNGKARTDRGSEELVNFRIYNYETGLWEFIERFAGSTTDQFIDWTNINNPADYVNEAGDMKLKWDFCAEDFDELWIDFECIKLTIKPRYYKWTFMVYLDSDWHFEIPLNAPFQYLRPNVEIVPGEKFGYEEMNEMEQVGSTSDVAIVVQMDKYYGRTYRYLILKDEDVSEISSPIVLSLGEVNMGVPSTLSDFIIWSNIWFPANHSALVFHDHGSGFQGVCIDEYSDDIMTMSELKNALNEAETTTGKTIDLIGFVACLMQMAEVAYQIKDFGKLLVGSEEVMYAAMGDVNIGWPFDFILADLTTTPGMDETELAQVIVDSFEDIFEIYNPPDRVPTISVVDLTQMDYFATTLDNFASCLITKLNLTLKNFIKECRKHSQQFYYTYYIDLYNFTENVMTTTDPDIIDAADTLLQSINQTVIYEWHWPEATPNLGPSDAHGISIFFPTGSGTYNELKATYESLDMSIGDHKWDDFLRAYLGIS